MITKLNSTRIPQAPKYQVEIDHKKQKALNFAVKNTRKTIDLDFKEAMIPTRVKWKGTTESYFCEIHFDVAINKIVSELESRFATHDTYIAMDLIAIVNDSEVETCVMERVAKHYRLDVEQFQSDHAIFQQFKADIDTEDMLLSQIAAELISSEVFHLMPDLYKVIVKLASMPISSCEAKESFPCLRRLKNHHGAGEALLPQPLEHGQSDVGEGTP